MDELYSLIRTLAEETLDDPPDMTTITMARNLEREEQALFEPKPPTSLGVTPAEPLTPLNYTYQTAESAVPIHQRGPSAEPTLTERVGQAILQVAANQKDPGPPVTFTEPLRLAGMAATVALHEAMRGQPASPAQNIVTHHHQATPDINVKHFIPNNPDVDFIGMFREFDSKVQLPDLNMAPEEGPMPAMNLTIEPPLSSEQYTTQSLQHLLTGEQGLDRMMYQ